jgi:ribosomal protein S18 acetylase RimI-like enzyme
LNIRSAPATAIDRIEPLWRALYRHQKKHGMLLETSDASFVQWAAALKPALGRFACLFVAEAGGKPIGFIAGNLKMLPAFLGGSPVGFISEVYVAEDHRRGTVGRMLLREAMQWFAAQKVERIELQVLLGNEGAREFYRKLGWTEELVQMTIRCPPKEAD